MTPLIRNIYLKILWKRGEIAPQEQFLLFSTIFCNLIFDFCVKTRTRFSLRDKRLFEITEVEITRVDCIYHYFIGRVASGNTVYQRLYSDRTPSQSITFPRHRRRSRDQIFLLSYLFNGGKTIIFIFLQLMLLCALIPLLLLRWPTLFFF